MSLLKEHEDYIVDKYNNDQIEKTIELKRIELSDGLATRKLEKDAFVAGIETSIDDLKKQLKE